MGNVINPKKQHGDYVNLLRKKKREILKKNHCETTLVMKDTMECGDWIKFCRDLLNELDEEKYPWKHYIEEALTTHNVRKSSTFCINLFWNRYYSEIIRTDHYDVALRVTGFWQNSEQVNKNVRLIEKIRSQFSNKFHPFREIQRHIQKYFITFAEQKKNFKDIMALELQDIAQTMCFVLIKFYNLCMSLTEKNADIFMAPVLDLLVRGEVYKIIMKEIKIEFKEEFEIIKKKTEKMKSIKLSHLKISKYYSYNTALRDQHIERQSNEAPPLPSMVIYGNSIEALRTLSKLKQPNMKLNQLQVIYRTILFENDEFWKGVDIAKEKLILDPDSLLSLIIYLIIKAQYPELVYDIRMMDLLISDTERLSSSGYYVVVFNCALKWLKTQEPENFSSTSINLKQGLIEEEKRCSNLISFRSSQRVHSFSLSKALPLSPEQKTQKPTEHKSIKVLPKKNNRVSIEKVRSKAFEELIEECPVHIKRRKSLLPSLNSNKENDRAAHT